jgi:flagellar motility protein MotE (MotC chaperone)
VKSVILISFLSFFVIFGAVFWLAGAFSSPEEEEVEEQVTPEEIAEEVNLGHQSLDYRSEDLERREAELIRAETAVQMEKAVIAEEFNKLNALRRNIDLSIGEMVEAQEKSTKKLAKLYESMPAKEAASILSGMDMELVLGVLKRMKERPAAKIMAALDPARAAALSSLMSSNTGAP